MQAKSKIRMFSLCVMAMGAISLSTPKLSAAAPVSECGVCYSGSCPELEYRRGQCNLLCNTLVAGACKDGIPGGWVCDGPGVYNEFWECIGNA